MTHTTPNNPAEALAALIARGVARYQESLPAYARYEVLPCAGEPVTDEEAQVELNVTQVNEERQRELCLSCPLADCLGIESALCPIRIEQRRVWRRNR